MEALLPHQSGGGGPQKLFEKASTVKVEDVKEIALEEAQQPWIKLGLGIGASCSSSCDEAQNLVTIAIGSSSSCSCEDTQRHEKPVLLTPTQLHELQQQALIYKHLAAALPVPLHLVIPIWKSVASCFGPAIYDRYPSFIGYFSPKGFDYRTMMDPEPGRCRRTDGKKWRCGKNVVPDQKYCERHMHRGRQRSRKPVEAFKIASPSESTPSNKLTDKLVELKTKHGNSTAVGLQLMTPSSTNSANSHSTSSTSNTNTPSSNIGCNKNEICDAVTARIPISATTIPATVTASITTTPATAPTLTANSNNKIDHNTYRKDMSGNYACYNGTMKSSRKRFNNINIGMTMGLDFSPKSVLQVQGCSGSCFGDRNGNELEPGRCRRTDGKKWRCSRDVVPDQKYCEQHMHRGAKKRVVASQTISVPPVSTAASHRAPPYCSTNIPNKAACAIPNTNLSISIQASPQLIHNDEKSTSSSSDTTITDTSITANEYGYVSS
ncbi:hypothetical protein ACB098_06G195600 [Castanea mollissima]|uniref:Growth-regulating factor n=1 Tax=Castanea mollissima TaxID=60419 RepID=A0A8J4RZC0_9ROSI|nr:hypothetical protein CMV_003718 [Castanea mollissima]